MALIKKNYSIAISNSNIYRFKNYDFFFFSPLFAVSSFFFSPPPPFLRFSSSFSVIGFEHGQKKSVFLVEILSKNRLSIGTEEILAIDNRLRKNLGGKSVKSPKYRQNIGNSRYFSVKF